MGSQVWSLISLGIGWNLVLGALVAAFKLPLYLDSLGTVLVAALAGPLAAAITAGGGIALLGLTSPTAFAFLPVGVTVGLASGLAARCGAFRAGWSALLAGALVGVVGAVTSAPIASVVFGGVTGGGTDLVVALLRAFGLDTMQAAFGQALAVDPLDKSVTFLLVYTLLIALPRRTVSSFPLGKQYRFKASRPLRYRPQTPATAGQESPAHEGRQVGRPVSAGGLPPVADGPKLLTMLSLLLLAGAARDPATLSLMALLFWALYAVAAPALTWQVSRRLVWMVLPIAVSLLLIHGLFARQDGEPRVEWLGLSWSQTGVADAWFFSIRVALMLLAVSVFFSTTSPQRLAELLLRYRVPYPLVFVLLTGASFGDRLRHRWTVVEQAQASRGLDLRPAGLFARARVLVAILLPTLGAVFSEIPSRAANLESRGFLSARPRAVVPRVWTKEPEPTRQGLFFQWLLTTFAWLGLIWAYVYS